jgi:hypothetical protein
MNPLATMSETPTPSVVVAREGGLTKFGGAPLGFGAMGVVIRSMPGGRLLRASMVNPD